MNIGLYEESHGIVHNDMWDPLLNKTFKPSLQDAQTIEWYGQNKMVEPIWITNQRTDEDRRSAAEWVGSNVAFNNESIVHIPYNHSTPYNELIDKFIALFTDADKPINFGALYFDEPGAYIHLFIHLL